MKSVMRKDVSDVEIPYYATTIDLKEEHQQLVPLPTVERTITDQPKQSSISNNGIYILIILALQNCGKNILMRYIMREQPQFLHSTAVILVELLKLSFAIAYIQFYELPLAFKSSEAKDLIPNDKNSIVSVYRFVLDDWGNTLLLIIPAGAYNLQNSLEYVAFANIDASTFSALVQIKMLFAAFFFRIVMKKKLCKRQFMSLIILTSGVMLCSIKKDGGDSTSTGILATIGIALTSGFASVYTEKVIKCSKNKQVKKSLAHTQAQLAIVSLVIMGLYTIFRDKAVILEKGFFYKFDGSAFIACFNSALGGVIVAAVLKYADSILKGYATAVSVVLTGIMSNILFGTSLSLPYGIGAINVICAVLLYTGTGLEDYIC